MSLQEAKMPRLIDKQVAQAEAVREEKEKKDIEVKKEIKKSSKKK